MVVDGSGNPIAWPGFEFTNGVWRVVPDNRRPNLTLTIEANPSVALPLTYPPATETCAAQPPGDTNLSGNVYHDVNNDGVFDPTENPIAGVTVTVTGPVTATTTTLADGSWSFVGLPAGSYTVTQTQPAGWIDGQDTPGTVGGLTTGSASSSNVFSDVVLAPGNSGIEYNFGELLPGTIDVSARGFCRQDVAEIDYDVTTFVGASAPSVTLTFTAADGSVVEQRVNQPAAGTALWPGMVVDADGNPTSWPGWVFVDGQWQVDESDPRRGELTLTIEVNPVAQVTLSYPPATPACAAQPPGTFRPPRPESIPVMPLPLLVLLGLLVLGAARGFRALPR
jgi:hypothetical protein